jgi:hypothetical protein
LYGGVGKVTALWDLFDEGLAVEVAATLAEELALAQNAPK